MYVSLSKGGDFHAKNSLTFCFMDYLLNFKTFCLVHMAKKYQSRHSGIFSCKFHLTFNISCLMFASIYIVFDLYLFVNEL